MSENTVYFVEEIVSLLRRELDLPASRVPLISTGGSMGGLLRHYVFVLCAS